MMRYFYSLVWILAALVGVSHAQSSDSSLTFDFVAERQIATGTKFDGTEFGGISGIDYDPATNLYYAISDDRSQSSPARFYTLSIGIDDQGVHQVKINSVAALQQPDGSLFHDSGVDAESIRLVPSTKTLVWSSERDAKGAPWIREMNLNGSYLRDFAVPDYYIPSGNQTGVNTNLAFEGLTLSADGKQVIAATESALQQDGPIASLEKGASSRILVLDLASGKPTAEYVYETGPITHEAKLAPYAADNGVSEIMALDDHTYLTVERSFAQGVGNTIHLYTVDFSGATNVTGMETIAGTTYTPVQKTLVFTLNEGDFGVNVDNIEGVTLGPKLNGKQTLILVSDNNFALPDQPYTQFVVFTISTN